MKKCGKKISLPSQLFKIHVPARRGLLFPAGFSALEALISVTSLPAKTFHLEKRGVISPGYRADLLLVKGNPAKNISDTRNILKIWIAGDEVKI